MVISTHAPQCQKVLPHVAAPQHQQPCGEAAGGHRHTGKGTCAQGAGQLPAWSESQADSDARDLPGTRRVGGAVVSRTEGVASLERARRLFLPQDHLQLTCLLEK